MRRELEAAEHGVAECPVERGNPQDYAKVHPLRSRALLDDVFVAGPVAAASAPAPDTDHRRTAPASAPQAGSAEVPARTSPSRSPEGSSMGNLADTYGTDVEIYPWGDEIVRADCRTGLPESGHRVLRSCGFTAPGDPGDSSCYILPSGLPDPERKIATTSAVKVLAALGYRVAIAPDLVARTAEESLDPRPGGRPPPSRSRPARPRPAPTPALRRPPRHPRPQHGPPAASAETFPFRPSRSRPVNCTRAERAPPPARSHPLGTAVPSPRTSAPSTTTGSDALLYLLFGVLGAAMAFGSLAWLTGNLTNTLVGSGPWAAFRATEALLHPEVLWPALDATALLVGARLVPGLLTLGLITTGLVLWTRWRAGSKSGLARKGDLAPLLDKEITAKAKSLRPSLGGREGKRRLAC